MPTAPTHPRLGVIPERILCYGPAGSGKTRNVLSVAKWHQDRGSDAVFRVMDTDMAYPRMLVSGEFADLENVEVYSVDEWPDYPRYAKEIREKNRPHDWMVIDLATHAWYSVQDHYIGRVFNADLSDYWERARIQGQTKDGTPLDGWQDWGVINKMYRSFAENIHRARCHVYATATAKHLTESRGRIAESADVTRTYGRLGLKPQGQKELDHLFHTVILCQQTTKGWSAAAAKDRERKLIAGEIGEFWRDYLVKIARWKA